MNSNSPTFAPDHRWDRNFFLVMLALAWLGIVMGFGGSIAAHFAKHKPPYPLIVHFHAFVFVGWLVLFTVQILLIRFKKLRVHRRLGMVMAGIAVLMVFLGPATALIVQHRQMDAPGADPAFLSIQFTDLLAFAGLAATGILRRKVPATHKRMMLMATLYITDAGFARWLGDGLIAWLGNGFWAMWVALYIGPVLLMLGIGGYDVITRHRLHPAYVAGVAWVFACQMTALLLYYDPSWLVLARRMIAAAP